MIRSYVSIDLETTGLNPKLDRIIEIGAIKVIDGVEVDSYSTMINPGRKIEERITELTGITDEDVKGAPSIEDVLDELLEFLEDLPLLGHHIIFDFSFLKKAVVNQKKNIQKTGIDTLRIARVFLQELEHRNLDFLCNHYGIPHKAHRALEDAKATASLYEKLLVEFYEKGETYFTPVPLVFSVKKDTPITKAQKERLLRLIDQHKLTVDYDVEKLTRSEASRYTDRIYAEYGR